MQPPSDQAPAVRQLRRAFFCSLCALSVNLASGLLPVTFDPGDPYDYGTPHPAQLPLFRVALILVALDGFFLLRAWHHRRPGFLPNRHVPALAFSFLLFMAHALGVPLLLYLDYIGYD